MNKIRDLEAKIKSLESENQKLRLIMDNMKVYKTTEELFKDLDELSNLKFKLAEAEKLTDSVRDTLNHHFLTEWINEKFQAEDYDNCDSLYTVNDIAKLFRERFLRIGDEVKK